MSVKGFKVFNPDFTCHGFQYAENTKFKFNGAIKICSSGFHFCEKASDCFSYYPFEPKNIVCEVEGLGKIESEESDSKKCTDEILIGRKLTWDEVLKVANEGSNNTGLANSGYSNSGDGNSGNWNSGNWNSGYSNSGNSNSGDWNSGNWNSGYSNSGYRNSGAFCLDNNPKLFLFDKPTNINVRDWENTEVIRTMRNLLEINEWIYEKSMTDEEKEKFPTYKTTGGYLKTKTLHEAWEDMWSNLEKEKKQLFLDLPNFDAEKFKIITGVDVSEDLK
jgi:hypothetical protein